ncbi:phosphatase PAP2 family protein [Haloplanus halophilus]|uniref:phosphatase PAP2 family protein n=1 Tax=Haloplanus halophilus TaxID=2949993 RepID=UPI00203B60A5|nr:phosphatase PAP2 family protein [Haloplanus sp. GDY1]
MSLVDRAVADRGVGETGVVETLPEALVAAAGLVTRLGDPLTLIVVVAAAYLLANRLGVAAPRMATALALTVGAFALTLALKHAFALPRPPGAGVDGYGFPSGHAIGATAVYGGLVALLPAERRSPTVVAAAGSLVALVAASRVVIGVHYLVDVIAGVAVGLAYLVAALRIGPGLAPERVTVADARRVFAVALAVGLAGVAVAVVRNTVVAVAAAGGGLLGWHLAADRVVAARGSTPQLAISVVTLGVVVASAAAVLDGGIPLAVAAATTVGVVALLIAVPGLSGTVAKKGLDVGR